jgi:hypothetical protein
MPLLLISGRPGAGKSEFCQWLATNRGFVHIETDCEAEWQKWGRYLDQGTSAAIRELSRDLRRLGRDVAFEWGFPPAAIDRVTFMRKAGFQPWWFDGDEEAARQGYLQRHGGTNTPQHEIQLEAIRRGWKVIEREFCGRPTYLSPDDVAATILVGWRPAPTSRA